MKALKIEHICGYLPYGLKMQWESQSDSSRLVISVLTVSNIDFQLERGKPLLRPLSDLTKTISHNGETFVPRKKQIYDNSFYLDLFDGQILIEDCPYSFVRDLMEWKFDVFGLIESGLAVDVNTLERNCYE